MSTSPPAVKLLFDECMSDNIWDAVHDHNTRGQYLIDVLKVGKLAALPKRTTDARILEWAEQNGRVVVSGDRNTMTAEFYLRLGTGLHSSGLLIVAPASIPDLVDHLAIVAHATTPDYWIDKL